MSSAASLVGQSKQKTFWKPTNHSQLVIDRFPPPKKYRSTNPLRELPGALTRLAALRVILIKNTQIADVPAAICALPQLRQLSLALSPRLRSVRPEISGLAATLEALDLSECLKLEALPAELFALVRLRRLELHSCGLAALPPQVSRLAALDHLSLHSNRLEALPSEIGACTALTWLSLNSNRLRGLPAEVGLLTNLGRLSLHINELESVPAELGRLVGLGALSLHSNKLTAAAVPLELSALTNLARLSLYQNPSLGRLPPCVGGMAALRELWAYECGLAEVGPEIGGCAALQKCWLDRNALRALPAELAACATLRELYLDGNPALEEVPPAVLRLPRLLNVFAEGTPAGARLAAEGWVPLGAAA